MVFIFKIGTTPTWFAIGVFLERLTFLAVFPIGCHVDASTMHSSLGQLMHAMTIGPPVRRWLSLAAAVQTLVMLPLHGAITRCAPCMWIPFVVMMERRGALAYGRKPSQNFVCTKE
jgi:hypothetical protein